MNRLSKKKQDSIEPILLLILSSTAYKIVVLFNYKDGEKCIHIDDVKMNINKENTQKSECSTLFRLVTILQKR